MDKLPLLMAAGVLGFISMYINIFCVIFFNDTVEDRVAAMEISVAFDVIILLASILLNLGIVVSWIFVTKYIFLAFVDFNGTLRQ
jgi:hypothetical protein